MTSLTHLDMAKCKLPDVAFCHLTAPDQAGKAQAGGPVVDGRCWATEHRPADQPGTQLGTGRGHACNSVLASWCLSQLTGLTSLALGLTQDVGSGSLARLAISLSLLRCLESTHPAGMTRTATCWLLRKLPVLVPG